MQESHASEIIRIFEGSEKKDAQALDRAKKDVAKRYRLPIPTNIDLYTSLPESTAERYKRLLITKPVRSISGVSVVAIMTKPRRCPHGKCSFCPGGVNSHFGDVPQSYTGNEPATMRAIRSGYDPYLQVFGRLEQFVVLGQMPEKIELILMGGTFLSYPRKYRENFIMNAFKAMNDFSSLFYRRGRFDLTRFKEFFLLPGSVEDKARAAKLRRKILLLKKRSSLKKEQMRNESSNIRCVGFTIETRPDYAGVKEAKEMRDYGTTRVEIGVESIYDDVLKKYKRGQTVHDSISATRVLRDFGFKIGYHMMLGLSEKRRDIEMFRELFASEAFRPDMLKIYPCMVFPGTELYCEWKKGKYAPLSTAGAAEIISEIKREIPRYVRIMRIQRDIPSNIVAGGVDRTNLRQYVDRLLADKKIRCGCIRCREVRGRKAGKIDIIVQRYEASGGHEFFISAEDIRQDILLGFIRLRFPATYLTKEVTKDSALVRELHVYGTATAIGEEGDVQHRGIGKLLVAKAEELARKDGKKKLVIISGIGVRGYYRKLGYRKDGTYVSKRL